MILYYLKCLFILEIAGKNINLSEWKKQRNSYFLH